MLDSLVGRALNQYRRGHGFESRSSLNFCQASISQQVTFKIVQFKVRLAYSFLKSPPRDKRITPEPYLPSTNRVGGLRKRPLENAAHLESICSYLYHIVKQRPEGGHRIGRREQERVTKLKEQLQIVVKCALYQKIKTLFC